MRCDAFSFRDPSGGAIALFWDPWISPGIHFRGNTEDGLLDDLSKGDLVLSIQNPLCSSSSGLAFLGHADARIPIPGLYLGWCHAGYWKSYRTTGILECFPYRVGNDGAHFLNDTLPGAEYISCVTFVIESCSTLEQILSDIIFTHLSIDHS